MLIAKAQIATVSIHDLHPLDTNDQLANLPFAVPVCR